MKGKRLLILGAAFALGISACAQATTMVRQTPLKAAPTVSTYIFNSKSWTATLGGEDANWTSGKDGAGFSNDGVQVTTNSTGANATSPKSFENISRIVVTYNTNKSAGAGTVVIQIGSNAEKTNNVAYSSGDGRTANYTTEFNYDAGESGAVKITVNTTTNSIYLKSISILEGSGAAYAVTYNANGGSGTLTDAQSPYTEGTIVTIKDNEFTRYGYNFVNWNTEADGSGTDYDERDTFAINNDVTLYAQWEEDPTISGMSGNPYTVAQARAAIDANVGKTGVYTRGIITQVDSFNSTYSSITYWISDDGNKTNQLEVYGGLGNAEHPFTSKDSVEVGATVVVRGNLTKYNGTYEYSQNNVLVSYADPVAIPATGIELNKARITLVAGYEFELTATLLPAGAVGDITWESSDEEVALVDNGNIEATGVGTATISAYVDGVDEPATCVVTVVSAINYGSAENPLSVSEAKVTLDATGADLSADQLYVRGVISKSHYDSGHSNYVVWLKSDDGLVEQAFELYGIVIDGDYTGEDSLVGYIIVAKGYGKVYGSTYELSFATIDGQRVDLTTVSLSEPELSPEEKINKLDSRSSLSYSYVRSAQTSGSSVDTLNKEFTGISGQSYQNWSGTGESGAVYAGNSYGQSTNIQLKSKDNCAGIVTTASGGKAISITVDWATTQADRVLDIYASNTAYSSPADLYDASTQGEAVGSITNDGNSTTFEFDEDYAFIGIRSNNGAIYLASVEIEWENEGHTTYGYSYSNVAIRFGGFLSKALWDDLKTESGIQGYGVELTSTGGVDEDFYTPLTETKLNPSLASNAQKTQQKVENLEDPYYVWNLYVKISNDDLKRDFTAVAYIKDGSGEKVYFKEVTFSAKSLAQYLIDNNVYGADEFEGSLSNLAGL